jgi:regulator of G-protein signaling
MKNYLAMSRNRVSQVAESLIDYTDTFAEYDPVLNPAIPSNPWVADDPSYWMLNQPL